MKVVKVSELFGVALDWAVARCEGWSDWDWDNGEQSGFFSKNNDCSYALFLKSYSPSTIWEHGGPIIDYFSSEESSFCLFFSPYDHVIYDRSRRWKAEFEGKSQWGETPLIAAMRCYVTKNLGDSIEVPDELFS